MDPKIYERVNSDEDLTKLKQVGGPTEPEVDNVSFTHKDKVIPAGKNDVIDQFLKGECTEEEMVKEMQRQFIASLSPQKKKLLKDRKRREKRLKKATGG